MGNFGNNSKQTLVEVIDEQRWDDSSIGDNDESKVPHPQTSLLSDVPKTGQD